MATIAALKNHQGWMYPVLTRKKLTSVLDTLNEVGMAARTKAEIDELGAHLADNKIVLRYSFGKQIALGVGVFVLTYFGAVLFDSSLVFIVGTGAAIAIVLDAIRLRARVGILCGQLVERSVQLDYGLVPVEPEPIRARAAKLEEIDKDSSVRRIWHTMQARYQGTDVGFSYITCHFERADIAKNTSQPSQQMALSADIQFFPFRIRPKLRAKKKDSIVPRSGILAEFPYASGLRISSTGRSSLYPKEYEPASYDFRRLFSCNGNNDAGLARFLNPATVDAILRASRAVEGLVVEVSKDNLLYLSTSSGNVTDIELPDYGNERLDPAKTSEALQRLLQMERPMQRLDALLKLAHELVKYHDSNFVVNEDISSSVSA
ncbi:hypothetical protein FE848_10315 [Marinobacter sp. 1-3A]|uniref:hypothetical protein n=1 Tax=Marinobacter sp. 1-3A TaxID=2582920 RepID=UPI001908E0B1|nr:hypothetical protein [Marinobacter sp. 1-3A]MBK1873618.1 hypothetical protein [Marinobacter sp. 1-3A]